MQRAKNGRWRYRAQIRLPDGTVTRISGTAPEQFNTKQAAQQAERDHVARMMKPEALVEKEEVPTFAEWFNGRFWTEWVIAQDNKPAEREAKESIYKHHLAPVFGELRLDKIDVGVINRFRATLLEKKLSKKRINNILAVLSKALRYADDVKLISAPRKIGLFKVERPEIEFWELEEYARVLAAAKKEGSAIYAAVCLAGEAGLRVGEVKALRWREDVDLIARTITVNQQMRRGVVGHAEGSNAEDGPDDVHAVRGVEGDVGGARGLRGPRSHRPWRAWTGEARGERGEASDGAHLPQAGRREPKRVATGLLARVVATRTKGGDDHGVVAVDHRARRRRPGSPVR